MYYRINIYEWNIYSCIYYVLIVKLWMRRLTAATIHRKRRARKEKRKYYTFIDISVSLALFLPTRKTENTPRSASFYKFFFCLFVEILVGLPLHDFVVSRISKKTRSTVYYYYYYYWSIKIKYDVFPSTRF